jgi:hypothetical protein
MAKEMKVGADQGNAYPAASGRKFRLHFQHNRGHQLHLPYRTIIFTPAGTPGSVQEVTEAELQSEAVQSQITWYHVEEVR